MRNRDEIRGIPMSAFEGNEIRNASPEEEFAFVPSGVDDMSDVLGILEKRRTPATHLHIDVEGKRANAVPARLTHIHLGYVIDGEGIDRGNTLRAIELAVTKYCSVRDSLDKSIEIDWSLVLNGEGDARG